MRSAQNPQPNEIETPFNLLRNLVVISIIAEAAALITSIVGNLNKQYLTINGYVLLATAISLIFLLRGTLLPAQILLPTSLFLGASYVIIFPGNGLHDINLLVYAVVISLAGLTLGERGAFVFTFLIILTIFGIGIAEISGVLISETSSLTALITPIVASIIVLTIAFIQRALINLLGESAKRARASEREVIERNNELQTFSAGLENLVQMRTSELERANQYNERRAKQFEAIGQVSRAINQTQGLQELLPQITQLISQQFSFYHVGIFLLDANNEYAVLAASNSEGGRKMLAREHKLKVGQVGIVGNVAGTGVARIALDTGADAIYFNNPDLPETRSEMALPLFHSGDKLVGVIDVQSTAQDAFGQDDIKILTALADQVSIAIANARLYEDTKRALRESEMLYRGDIQTGWDKFTRSQKLVGIRRQGLKSNILLEPMKIAGAAEVNRSGEVYKQRADGNDKSSQTTVPMKLRGEVVGMLNIKTDDDRIWSPDEMDIITAIIQRAALSIDNARLLSESRNAAEKERVIGEISAKISAGTEIETILKTAVRELGNQIGGVQITVEMGSGDE